MMNSGSGTAEAAAIGLMSRAAAFPGATVASVIVAIFIVAFFLVAAPVDAEEPPVLNGFLPLISYWISLNMAYPEVYVKLAKDARRRSPIFTVRVLNKKAYIINTPPLVQNAMRNKALGFDSRIEDIASLMGIPNEVVFKLTKTNTTEELAATTVSALSGDNLMRLNLVTLDLIARELNTIQPKAPLMIDNFFEWCRNLIGTATTRGLYGRKNPDYEAGVGKGLMGYGVISKIIALKAFHAQKRVNEARRLYYAGGSDADPTTSALVRERAKFWRRLGVAENVLSMTDALGFASTTNTVPTMYWLTVHVFSDRAILARLREDLIKADVIKVTPKEGGGGRVASIGLAELLKNCPFLIACYRETLRLYATVTGTRSVVKEDTQVTDPVTGRSYMLKAGNEVRWSARVAHMSSVWGDDWQTYKPNRWLEQPIESSKDRRDSFMPFGGGKHLCPGRNFAFAELVGCLAAMATGFEVEGIQVPNYEMIFPSAGTLSPIFGSSSPAALLARRSSWDDVEWTFRGAR